MVPACNVDLVATLSSAAAVLSALALVLWRIAQLVEEFRGHNVLDAADHATANGLTWQDGYRAGVLHAHSLPVEVDQE